MYDLGAEQDFLNRVGLTTSKHEMSVQKGPHYRLCPWARDRSGETLAVSKTDPGGYLEATRKSCKTIRKQQRM